MSERDESLTASHPDGLQPTVSSAAEAATSQPGAPSERAVTTGESPAAGEPVPAGGTAATAGEPIAAGEASAAVSETSPLVTEPTGPGGDASESSGGEGEAPPPEPKMVRRVVVSYQLGWLPGDWLQTWRRLDRVFARAGLDVKATLAPLEDLPSDTDILVVPPELREPAREAVPPGTPILITPASAAAGAFGELVTRLQEGTEFTAQRVDPDAADKPKIVSYRGHTLLD